MNRVYLVNSVDVGITRESATGAGASGSTASAASLPLIDVKTLNKTLDDSLATSSTPSGTVRFTGASSRSLSFNQQFPRPLVVGYIGYDIPLLPGGKVGAYSSTLQTLTGKSRKTSVPPKPIDDYANPGSYPKPSAASP